MTTQKAPRGRPPFGAVLVDGHYVLTEEALTKAASRFEKHRADCRERYRKNRAALARQRPDLFKYKQKPWMQEWQTTLMQNEVEQASQNAEP